MLLLQYTVSKVRVALETVTGLRTWYHEQLGRGLLVLAVHNTGPNLPAHLDDSDLLTSMLSHQTYNRSTHLPRSCTCRE
ncbi:hypothetical protein RRG08_045546 [Elysia crispata]|uniref:Uncharacterized protein n=1 Tax=Elysia crispata TaxID=231223 RepID=A0AAE1ACH8_9GAST|nr:hypothetical protein RRG08_045546 [Elysia crispata]